MSINKLSLEPDKWDLILELLEKNQTDEKYLAEIIRPQIQDLSLISFFDNLGEHLIFYAIIYQNTQFLNQLLQDIQYFTFTEKIKKKVRASIFRGIKQLSYDCETNFLFLQETFQNIAQSSFKTMLADFVKEGQFSHLFENVFPRKRKSTELMKHILEILHEYALFQEDDQEYINLKKIYDQSGKHGIWNHFLVRNFINSNSSFPLKSLKYEFYHYAAEKGLFNQIDTFNLVKRPEFLFKKHSSGENVFLTLFKKSPFDFLQRNLDSLNSSFQNSAQNVAQVNNRKQTFIHLLISNKKMTLEEKINILLNLDKKFNFEENIKIADHNNMIPLVAFIATFSSEIKKNHNSFAQVLDLLVPQNWRTDNKKNIMKIIYSLKFNKILNPKLDLTQYSNFENLKNDELIYNQKFIKICLHFKLEDFLIQVLQKYSQFDIDSFYSELFPLTRHFICIVAENNCKEVLKWIFKNKVTEFIAFQPLMNEEILRKELEKANSDKMIISYQRFVEFAQYSIFDEILDLILSPSFSFIEEETKSLLIDIFEQVWNNLSSNDKEKAFLNITFNIQIQQKKLSSFSLSWPRFLLTKIYQSENSHLLGFLKNDLKAIRVQDLPDDIKKSLLFDFLSSKIPNFLTDIPLQNLMTFKESLTPNELSTLTSLVFHFPELAEIVYKSCYDLQTYFFTSLFSHDLASNYFRKSQKEKISKFFSPLLSLKLKSLNTNDEKEALYSLINGSNSEFILCKMLTSIANTYPKEVSNICNILAILNEKYKIINKLPNIQHNTIKKFLDSCGLIYIKSLNEDIELENELSTAYNYYISQSTISKKTNMPLIVNTQSLSELRKAGKLKIKGWNVELLDPQRILKEIKQKREQTLESLYILAFLSCDEKSIHNYAIEICKNDSKGSREIKMIYEYYPQHNFKLGKSDKKPDELTKPEPILISQSIRNGDVSGLESVIRLEIYQKKIEQFRSPFYALLELLKRFKLLSDKQILTSLNKIFSITLANFVENQVNFLFPHSKEPITHYDGSYTQYCLLCEDNLMEYLSEDNFEILPPGPFLENTRFISFKGVPLFYARFYVEALFKRTPETIKRTLSYIFKNERKPEVDKYLLHFTYLLMDDANLNNALDIFQKLENGDAIKRTIISCLKYCFCNNKEVLSMMITLLFQNKLLFTNADILQQFKSIQPKDYSLLKLSNCFEQIQKNGDKDQEGLTALAQLLLEIDYEDFVSILNLLEESRTEDLKKFILQPDLAKILGNRGLYMKLEKIFEKGKKMISENTFNTREFMEFTGSTFISACETQKFILLKSKIHPKLRQLNIHQLYQMIKIKEKGIYTKKDMEKRLKEEKINIPFHFKFLQLNYMDSVEANYTSHELNSDKIPEKIRLDQRSQKSKVKTKIDSNLNDKKPKYQKVERKYNIFGFELNKKYARKVALKEKISPSDENSGQFQRPASLTTFFLAEKTWNYSNAKDKRDIQETAHQALTLLNSLIGEKFSEETHPYFQQVLIEAVRLDLTLVEKTLEDYLDSLSGNNVQNYFGFFFAVLKTLFGARNIYLLYKIYTKSQFNHIIQKEKPAILSLLNRLKDLNRIEKSDNLDFLNPFANLLLEIYCFNDHEISNAFCTHLMNYAQNKDIQDLFGISIKIIIGLFINLTIENRNLTHFSSLIQLDRSLNHSYKITEPKPFSLKTAEEFEQNLKHQNIMLHLMTLNLFEFVAEYEKLDGTGQLLLQPINNFPRSHSNKLTILSNIAQPIWLHLLLIKGSISLVQKYLSKFKFLEKEIECAFLSENYDLVHLVMNKVYENNLSMIINYLKNNNMLLKLSKRCSEGFILKIFKGFINNSDSKLESSFYESFLKEIDEDRMSIFHYIAQRQMPKLLYEVLDFLKKKVCQNNVQTFKKSLEFFFNQIFPSSNEDQTLSPYDFATLYRFYELTTIAMEFQIPIKLNINQDYKISGNYLYLPSNDISSQNTFTELSKKFLDQEPNEFNALYIGLSKLYFKTLDVVHKLRLANSKNLPKNWSILFENLYFQPRLDIIDANTFSNKENFSILKSMFLDTVLIKIFPELISLFLSTFQLWEFNPLFVIYLINKSMTKEGLHIKDYSSDLLEKYLKEIQTTISEVSREETLGAKLWLDTELNVLIEGIRKTLYSEQKEIQTFESLSTIFTEQNIAAIVGKFNEKGYKITVKVLIHLYPNVFLKLPNYSINQQSSFNFWLHFTSNPDFMCETISSLNSQNFNLLISKNVNDILQLVEQSDYITYHEIKSFIWCLSYIAFSFKAEKDQDILSSNHLHNFVIKMLRPLLIKDDTQIETLIVLFQRFLKFISKNSLTYEKLKNIDSHLQILFLIGFELRNLLKPLVITGASKPQDQESEKNNLVEIEDIEIDKNIEICLDSLIKTFKEEENPLIVYTNALLIIFKFYSIIQEITYWAKKFEIVIHLSFKENENLCMAQMEKLNHNMLKITINYSIHYDKDEKNFIIQWDKRSTIEIEKEITSLFLLETITKILNKNFKSENNTNIIINYDSFREVSIVEQFKFLNSECFLQESYSNNFGIIPFWEKITEFLSIYENDKLTQVNEVEPNHPPLQLELNDAPNKTLILHEFYSILFPQLNKVTISYINSDRFFEMKGSMNLVQKLLQSLAFYEEKVIECSKMTEQEIKLLELENVEWFIGGESLSTCHKIFYEDILKIREIMNNFETKVNKSPTNDLSIINWKINIQSFIKEIIFNLIETISLALSSSKFLKGNVFNIIENYLNYSLLNKVIYSIIQTVSEITFVTNAYHAFYFIFEKSTLNQADKIESFENYHFFDKIIRFSRVKFNPCGKTLLITIPYFIPHISLDDLQEYTNFESQTTHIPTNKIYLQDYFGEIFNKFDIYSQLLTKGEIFDTLLNKKEIENTLINLSTKISGLVKKQISFTADYSSLLKLCQPLLEKVHSSSTPRKEANEIFIELEDKILKLTNYILNKFSQSIENSILSAEYMNYFATKIQIQNFLYRNKKPLSEFLKEETLNFNIYPAQNPDNLIIADIPKKITEEKFSFLIQTNKELTVPNALPGQQYLIFKPNKVQYFKVTSTDPLPYFEDAHYLLISSTWPDLEFCSNKFNKVLILDGTNRIIDVTQSCFKNLIQELQTEDLEKFSRIYPLLINKNFSSEENITIDNIFSVYPSLVTLKFRNLEPSEKGDLPSLTTRTSSHLYDDQRYLEIFFSNYSKINVTPLFQDDLKFSQKVRSDGGFQSLIFAFQSEFTQKLKTLGIKELVDKEKLNLPQISFEFDPHINWNIYQGIEEFTEELKPFISSILNVLLESLMLPLIRNSYAIQEMASILYDNIYLENNLIAFRSLISICRTFSEFHLHFTNKPIQDNLIFDQRNNSIQLYILVGEKEDDFSLQYPSELKIKDLVQKVLVTEELNRKSEILDSLRPLHEHDKVLLDLLTQIQNSQKITFTTNLEIEISDTLNGYAEIYFVLLSLDLLLWNITMALALCKNIMKNTFQGLNKVELRISNSRSHQKAHIIQVAQNSDESFSMFFCLFNSSPKELTPTYQQVFSMINEQIKMSQKSEMIFSSCVKPLSDLAFALDLETKGKNFEIITESIPAFSKIGKEKLNIDSISALLFGIQDLKTYYCESFINEDTPDIEKQSNKIATLYFNSDLPTQNYLIFLILNDKYILKPMLANIYKTNSQKFNTIMKAMEDQNTIKNNTIISSSLDKPFYIIAEFKKDISDFQVNQQSLVHYLNFSTQEYLKTKVELVIDLDSKKPNPPPKSCKVRSKMVDDSRVLFKITTFNSLEMLINAHSSFLIFPFSQNQNLIHLKFFASSSFCLGNTRVIAHNGFIYSDKKETDERNKISQESGYVQIYQSLDKVAVSSDPEIYKTDDDFIQETDLKRNDIQRFMDTNFIQSLRANEYSSIAGQERIETLQFRNKFGASVLVKPEDITKLSVKFVHNRGHHIIFKGVIYEQDGNILVQWRPLIKGSYSLVINNILVQSAKNLIVLAGPSCNERSTFRWPKMENYAFYDSFSFEAEFRDKYGNRLNQAEVDLHHKSEKTLTLETSAKQATVNLTFGKVQSNGIQIGNGTISPLNLENVFLETDITFTFLLHNKPIHKLTLPILGVGFKKRFDLFHGNLTQYRPGWDGGGNVTISRGAFFKELLELPLKVFKGVYNVKFKNEPGADAGGLKREFWELIGKEFKNSSYKILNGSHDRYYLSYDYVLNEKTKKSLKLYGATLAGSIINKQLIGVYFASAFSKALFNHKVDLEDLKEVFGDQVFNNYKMLLNMSQQELEDLEQYFVVNINKKQYELVEGGKELQVTKQNVNKYLELLVEFYLIKYHEEALKLIKEGFDEVFPFTELSKWFVWTDLSFITYGTLNVTGQNILKVTKFSNHETLTQFFTQFIMEADSDLLRNFLKFVTGSSALPYDDPFYSLYISFENKDSTKLPISHTCSKHLEVPKYKSYAQMKKMLTIAFVHASEGFGFA